MVIEIAMISLYLGAIVAANWSVATFGVDFIIINTFVLIAFDLTARDVLHERWHGKHVGRNMALLILAGSCLSALLNADVARVALASLIAFAVTGAVDTLVYQRFFDRSRIYKINVSNVVSAITDSVIFVILAFGWSDDATRVILTASVAKIAGGFLWSLLLVRITETKTSVKTI